MTDRPIIFSAPMVRALLDGRKTQTRRVLPKSHPRFPHHNQINMDVLCFDPKRPEAWYWDGIHGRVGASYPLRYAVGDRLYVREAFWTCDECAYINYVVGANSAGINDRRCCASCDALLPKPKKSPIHMPRWASRLTLTVTDVRVQRLQEISEADAWAEGCKHGDQWDSGEGFFPAEEPSQDGKGFIGWDCARDWYADLWDSLHGPDAWDANPWVVAVSFSVQHGNIDQIGGTND